jgi:cytosine/adenosine deaminase-related metal-dependent hydrolase
MILSNVQIVGETGSKNIHINNGIISSISNDVATALSQELVIDLGDAIAFPGLINSHDHLDFNLFPQLGNHIYKNYVEWGDDIHAQNKPAIDAILKIPKELRTKWGIYKNLLNGVTTVINHGEKLDIPVNIITVFQNCHSLHSVKLEHGWKLQLNSPFAKKFPFAMHVGEGTDNDSHEEIDEVIKWNLLKRNIIGIHGVAMDTKQAASFQALVWCPGSNFFLLGATAAIDNLKSKTKILFGTDSTVSANWNIWQQLRIAKETKLLTDKELIAAVSTSAAGIWKLNNTGTLREKHYADIVIAKNKNTAANNTDNFFGLNSQDILLVISKGNIVLFDELLRVQLQYITITNYSRIFIKGSAKYVSGDLPLLIKEIKKYNPDCSFPIEIA